MDLKPAGAEDDAARRDLRGSGALLTRAEGLGRMSPLLY